MKFIQIGNVTVNLEAIARIEWDFSGRKNTAMITFVASDSLHNFYWVQDAAQTEKLRHAVTFDGEIQ